MHLRPAAAVSLLALALTVACAKQGDEASLQAGDQSEPRDRTETTDAAPGTSDDRGEAAATLAWDECGGGAECAELDVPLDYADPSGETIPLSVTRVRATGDRIGSLFVNPGGPGALAGDFAISLSYVLPADITDRFDIVGVDPRGLGASDIDCGGDPTELYGVDYTIDSPEDSTALIDVSQDYIDGCQDGVGDLLGHLGTEEVARDIDAVRAAMGDEELNYLGFSYGTAIGQELAELFPERVRALVLDGVLELGPTGLELAAEQAAGFEVALQAYADDCNDDPSCPIGPDAVAKIEELTAKVEEAPIDARPRDLGPGELATGLTLPLYSESLWPELSSAVADALDGDGSAMVGLADEYLSLGDTDIYFAVNCLDAEWPETPEEVLAAGTAAEAESPHFGQTIVNDYIRCAMWPVEEDPLVAGTAPDAPPILVVSTTNDPATPYEAGVRTAERLASGVLLTYEGDGHTVVGNGVSCVDDLVVEYLVDLTVPEDGTTC